MALRKKGTPPVTAHTSMAAARLDLKAPNWKSYRFRNEQWQVEAWRFYDLIGELHAAANWMGSACSRVRIYVADIDKYGRIGEEAAGDEIQAIADSLFGGPAARAEAMRSIGINLTIAGECYIVGRSINGERDEWYILSPNSLRFNGDAVSCDLGYGHKEMLRPNADIAIRVWTPHPRMGWTADSPTRGSLLALRQLELLTRHTFSQIDSRLTSGTGMLIIPPKMDFPDADPEETPAESVVRVLTDAMTAPAIQDGSAQAVVPIVVERPAGEGENNKFELLSFESPLSKEAKEMRDEAIRRLALSLDMPPEILLGTGDTNHWSAWHIEESTVKIHVEPMLNRICDALTKAYLQPALKILGKDTEAYTFWFDTAPLTVRPNRLQDTLNLYQQNVVSREAVLEAGSYNPNTDAPDEDEDNRRYMRELLLRDPSLFAIPEVRELIGITVEFAEPEQPPPGAPPPPAPDQSIEGASPEALPQQPATTDAVVASVVPDLVPRASSTMVAADLLVHHALRLAGKRLHKSRERDQWMHIPAHKLHTFIKVQDRAHAERILMGAWEHMDVVTGDLDVNPDEFRLLLHNYCIELLIRSMEHGRSLLSMTLTRGGMI